jgi:hypothetical protein
MMDHNGDLSNDDLQKRKRTMSKNVPIESLEELNSQFHQALLKGDVADVHEVLKKFKKANRMHKGTSKILQTWRDEEQFTALHIAAERNNLPLVEFLVSKNANLNDQNNKTKCTPLVLAATKGNLQICHFLLQQKKVDVNIVNIDSTSALHYLVRHRPTKTSDINLLQDIYRLLFKKKADPEGENFKGEAPIHQATRAGNEAAIVALLKSRANLNHQNKNGETALHYAVMLGRTQVVQKLLTYGVNKNIQNNAGLTALDIAIKEHRTEIADIIQSWNENEQLRTEEKERLVRLRRYERMVVLFNEFHFFAKTLSLIAEKQDYERLAKVLLSLSLPAGTTVPLIRSLVEVEFEKNTQSSSVLRGNCPASKVMGAFSRQIGQEYLNNCIGEIVQDLVFKEHLNFELDPVKLPDEADVEAALERNRRDLLHHATAILHRIVSPDKLAIMPREVRAIAGFIAENARMFCPDKEASLVGGFIMLRLINPSLVAPESYGMLPLGKSPSMKCRRNLIMLAKLLQNLSNGIEFGVKEAHMACVNSFIKENNELLNNFFVHLATDPDKKEGEEDWADCKVLNVQPMLDVTLMDLDELVFMHQLLHQHKDTLRNLLKEGRDRGRFGDREFNLGLALFKQLENLGVPPPKK